MNEGTRFILRFLLLFLTFYGFNIGYIGIVSPGGLYIPFLDEHCNYIAIWRNLYISVAAKALEIMGYTVSTTEISLKVQGHSGFRLVYSCLGYGIMSCFSAFTLSFPKPIRSRLTFLLTGLLVILILNLCRFILLPLFYNPQVTIFSANHHDIFNVVLYIILLAVMYKWVNT
ncbi:exosortase Y [Pedobacter nyackensis]|uniref:exosortase Y n=1 Tax=Pedobacter nyackensis TaxID=475255 RepID=UPI00293084B7|nr:archaeosortase/exosortase family protein [Pedobacter nyackensis]